MKDKVRRKGGPKGGGRKPLTVLAVVVVIVLAGGGLAYLLVSRGGSDEGALIFYSGQRIASLDPADAADLGSRLPVQNIYETLVRQSASSPEEFVPALATSWSLSPDGLWYNFTLRGEVVFSNGNAFNASDVSFTLERVVKMASPDTGTSILISNCVDLSSTRPLDDLSISIKLLRPTPAFLSYVAQAFPLGIVDREYTLAHYSPADKYAHDFMRVHPMGTGPYRLHGWTVGTGLTLTANPEYWDGWDGRHVSKIVIREEVDPQLRLESVRDGRADAAELSADLVDAARAVEGARVLAFQSAHIEIVAMNVGHATGAHTFMSDPAVRKAFSYAFDDGNASESIYHGFMQPLSGCIPYAMPYANASQPSKSYSFNLTRASELLNSSGHTLDVRGNRFNGSAVNLLYDAGDSLRVAAAQDFASNLRKLGVLVDLDMRDWSGAPVSGTWDMYLVPVDAWYLDPENYVTALAVSSSLGGDSYGTGVSSYDVDLAAARASTALTASARISNYTIVWQQLTENPNMIYAGQVDSLMVVRSGVEGVLAHPITSVSFYSVWES